MDGKWIKVNSSVCSLLGYTEKELMGMTFQDITHPDDLDKDLENVHKMIDGEIKTYQMEKRYFHKSKRTVWVRLSVSMVRDPEQKPLYFISQIEDITYSKKMEEQLIENEQRLQLATSSAKLGVWDLNVLDNSLMWDDQMFELYGVTRKSFQPSVETWKKILHPDDAVATSETLKQALKEEKEFNTEFRVVWPDGTVKVLKGTALVKRNKKG